MIYNALNITIQRLNDFLKLEYSNNGNYLELSNLFDHTGSLALLDSNKIIATLVNIERETAMGIQHQVIQGNNNKHTAISPPVYLNLYLLFSSLYTGENYAEGLKFISSVIEFFQSNGTLNHSNTPQLEHNIEKLTFEIVNLDFQNLSQLWGMMGGKYLPSVLYKIRMLCFDQKHIKEELHSISHPQTNIQK